MNIAGADHADDTVKGPTFQRDGRRQHLARVARLALFVVVVASAVLLVWPQAFGAQRLPGIAQLIAFRAPVGIALAALAVVAGVAALVCPASSSWQDFFSFEVGDGGVGQAEVHLHRPVPSDRLVRADLV
ncbi:hypothetical protein, partial [Microbacterium sp. 18062]|uniref:hypothetical protein n=1 Tax=Microbacterium sp. 18062 TaxID=2681410 RepID=UPI00359FD7CF